MEIWFTYRVKDAGKIVRIGKGHVESKTVDAIESYLSKRYGDRRWDYFEYQWHSSEAAALKAERKATDAYENAVGELPVGNEHRGGGGGRVFVRCKAKLADGQRCQNDALEGNYGFCGVHRP